MGESMRLVDAAGRPARWPMLMWRRGRPSLVLPASDGAVPVPDGAGEALWIGGTRVRAASGLVVPVAPPSPALALLAVALLARVVAVWVLEPSPLVGDEGWYLRQATGARLAGVSWWFDPSLRVPFTSAPLVPALGAVAQGLLGDGERPLRLLSAVGGALVAPAAWQLGRALGGWWVGLVAGLVVALHPELVVFGAHLWTEALYTALVAGWIAAMLAAPPRAWVAGALLGAAVLTREAGLALPAVVVGWWALQPRARARSAALMLLAAGAVVGPYVARARFDPRITGLMSSTSSFNLYIGNVRGGVPYRELGEDQVERDAAAADLARAAIAEDPLGWFVDKADVATRRLVASDTTSVLMWTSPTTSDLRARPRWRWMDGEGAREGLAAVSRALQRVVLLVGAGGLVASLGSKRREVALVLVAVVVAVWLPAVVTVSKPRFLLPALPALAVGVAWWTRGRGAWTGWPWAIAAAATVAGLWAFGA